MRRVSVPQSAQALLLCILIGTTSRDGQQLDSMKLQHKEECKGLIIQIRYLKAKWTRENTLRSDLSNQKRYLLVILARCDRK